MDNRRFHHPHLLISGKEKLRREKVKLLEREMGGFNGDDTHLHSTNTTSTLTSLKFKLPKKIFSDSSTSIPRKLRSAIRKRSCESGSVSFPGSKRLNNGVNGVGSLGSDSFKNSKQNGWSDRSPRQTATSAISKDEEEVAETLFALAGMIPLDSIHENKKIKNDEKSLDVSRKQYSDSTPSFDDNVSLKEEPEKAISSPNKLSERRQINLNLQVSIPPVPFQIPPLLRTYDSNEQNTQSMLNELKPEITQHNKQESLANLKVTGDLLAANENKNNALTSKLLPNPGVDGLSVRSSVTPSWLHNTSAPVSDFFKDAPSASKVSCSVSGGRKSWKRCIAHVCISHLIQELQNSEGKDIQSVKPNQMRPLQCSDAENKDNLTATLAPGHMFSPGSHKTGICQAKEEGSSFSVCCASNKQSYNFLSLSTGVGTEVNNGVNRIGVTLEAKGNVHQLHSVGQHNTYLPCSMPPNHFPPISYRDQAAVISGAPPSMTPQVNLQLPPYFGNPCGPAHIGSTTRSTQHPPSKQQQIWTAQLAAHLRPGPFLSTHIPNWKNSTRDSQSMTQIQAPRPSQESMGAKLLQISSQQPQQQLFGLCQTLPSMSSTKLQSGQQPPPLVCEDKGGRFHQDGVLPLQLLCNERLLS